MSTLLSLSPFISLFPESFTSLNFVSRYVFREAPVDEDYKLSPVIDFQQSHSLKSDDLNGSVLDTIILGNIETDNAEYFETTSGVQFISQSITVESLTGVSGLFAMGASITISSGFDAANDVLSFTAQHDITGSYNAATGVLTLSGLATIKEYQDVLRSVTYENSFTTESTASRTFSFTVTDSLLNSNEVSRTFDMTVDETVNGTEGVDIYYYGFGDDTLYGLGGNDRLYGGEGNDNLFGGQGDDLLYGGLGADHMDGGDGFDTVNYVLAASGVTLHTINGGSAGEAGGDTYTSIEKFFGSNHDDHITGGDNVDTIVALDGDDFISGGGGGDFLRGNDGDDTLYGDEGNDSLAGNAGNDSLYGGTGDDILAGNEGNDILYGEAGNDFLKGIEGNNFLYGGSGNDRLSSGTGADALHGGEGIDIAIYVDSNSGVNVNLSTNSATGGNATGDVLVAIENISGSLFDDVLTGDDGVNTLIGLEGNDILFGKGGDDILSAQSGDDKIYGGSGNDTIVSDSGDNELYGEAGNDAISGGTGSDFIVGGIGDDSLIGGASADQFVFGAMHGDDIISDFEDGIDVIVYGADSGITDFTDLVMTQIGSHVEVSSSAGSILLFNTDLADMDASDFVFEGI